MRMYVLLSYLLLHISLHGAIFTENEIIDDVRPELTVPSRCMYTTLRYVDVFRFLLRNAGRAAVRPNEPTSYEYAFTVRK